MKSVLIALAMVGMPISVVAQEADAEAIGPAEITASEAAPETLSTGEDNSSRLTVPVTINGKGPYHFIIDTGSDRSVISREVADSLGLPSAGKARMVSMGGVNEVRIVRVDSLRVSANRELKGLVAPALSSRNLGADGLLGLDALKGQRIEIDFAAQTMRVEPGEKQSGRKAPADPNVIVVRGRSRLGQLVLVDADANDQSVWVVVDTGGQNTVGNSAFRKLMNKGTPPSGFRRVELLTVVGDRLPADYAVIGRMRIGGVQLGNAAVAFVDAHPFKVFGLVRKPALMLGMESLRSFPKVSIDFANKQVRFHMPTATVAGASR